jgi:SAM-dependent methyltransferase
MSTGANQQTTYALGHSQQELQRLVRQAEVFAPFTRQLFTEAGIGPGMRVLDVGSGAGGVSFLAAELVGRTGHVVGADISWSAVEYAMHRAKELGLTNIEFVVADPALMDFAQRFDAVVGRLILMYYRDPAEALLRLADQVHPGGIIAFQEFDMSSMRSFPPVPTFEAAASLMKQAFNASGARVNVGLELNSFFIEAGLPEPTLRLDAVVSGAKFPYDIVAATIHNLAPMIDRLRRAPVIELESVPLERRMREEALACNAVALSPGLVGAWARLPA